MTTVGVTGHMGLTLSTRVAIRAEMDDILAALETPLIGLSSLAPGADQIFAEAILAAGGELVFVQPCEQIERSFSAELLPDFRALRDQASSVVAMPFVEPTDEAYEAAGFHVADVVDLLVAVWNGGPSGGRGGTADVVLRRGERSATVVWPEGSARG